MPYLSSTRNLLCASRLHTWLQECASSVGVFLLCLVVLTGCTPVRRQQGVVRSPAEQALSQTTALEAQAALERGDCRRSIEAFNAVLIGADNDSRLYTGLGMAYLECNDPQNAITAFEGALRINPNDAQLSVNLATALFQADKIRDAEKQFDRVLQMTPSSYEAVIGKSAILLRNKQPEQALKVLRGLIKMDTGRSEALYNRGIALYQMGLLAEASALLEQYTRQYPKHAEAANALGVIRFKQARYDEAYRLFSVAVSGQPESGSFYYNRANTLRELKRFKDALTDYTRAIAFSPELVEAHINKGDINFLLGNTTEGCQDLEYACDQGSCERLEKYRETGRCKGGL